MTEDERARKILEELDKVLQIDWNREEQLIKAIKRGLRE